MSAIDDLKNGAGITIDTTSGDDSASADVNLGQGISIDATNENAINVVDLSGLSNNKRGHKVVLPRDKSQPGQSESSGRRSAVNISTIAIDSTEEDPDIHESLQKDLLDMNNPDSVFSKYLKEQKEEAVEYIAGLEEEKATREAEEAEDLQLDAIENENRASLIDEDVSYEIEDEEMTMTSLEVDLSDIDTEDISDMFKDDEEDNMSAEETKEKGIIEDDIPTEEEIDAEALAETSEILEEEDIEEIESDDEVDVEAEDSDEEEEVIVEAADEADTEVVEESKEKKEEVAKPERLDAPEGIDAEIEADLQNFATEIVEEDETNSASNNTDDEILKNLQKLATEKLKPVSKSLDLSSFTILKKPVTNITPVFEAQKARVAKWVLPNQESIVLMKEFSGAELERLREYSEDNRSIDSLNRRFHLIYDHIVSPKPQTFEQWIKTAPYEDVDHYFFAVYIASFKGANYLPADCPNPQCGETYLSEDIKVMDMVKFENKEARKKFADLYQSEATPAGKGIYCTEVVAISDKIAVSFREPSIYNIFELAGLDDRTRTNYANILEYIPYIDTIYVIDSASKTLTPITYKMYPDNANRTTRSKIQKYENIFNTLSVDEFGPIKAYVSAIADRVQGMYYVYPSVSCPKCGNATEESRATAESLVFTRYQLGALTTTVLS